MKVKALSSTGTRDGEIWGREDAEGLESKEQKKTAENRKQSRINFCGHNEWAAFIFRNQTTSPQSYFNPINRGDLVVR